MFSRVFVRAASNAAKAGVKPPVKLFGVEGTYASALFTAASKETSVESASSSLIKLSSLIKEDAKLKHIMENPALSTKDRAVVVDSLVKSSANLDKPVVNLLKVLAENNKLGLFDKISSQFSILNDAHNGLIRGSVTTAQPLDSKNFKRLEKALQQSSLVGQQKTLKLDNVVKPDIKGGLIVEVGDQTIDLSVSSKIQKLNKVLEETI
ncbi:ATP synthase delta (OSCP) subunit [Nakaseomyces glabratus]|nr:ATP synthase delta (OSCP) subunit [Nakaseomyces glabratus]KAH7613099.1 ATP synthase delta (OSCP) subunit [Nakaseomyces glabratus]